MDTQKLHDLLHQLQTEIENTDTLDEQDVQLLKDLDEDIRALLARAGAPEDTFTERLESALYDFEATHPTLTVAISKVLDSLSGAGI
ncbi:MAG: DUF4404 family protein [Anaerolineales bacterium]|nr:DUF4404 family protein [Anaerolineales bacterium]